MVTFGSNVGGFMSGAGLVTAGLAGVAAAVGISVKSAGDFQQSITKLYTTAGEAKGSLQMVGDGILAMSSQVGTGAQTLSGAMYWIESGGLHGAQGLEALRVAAQAAKAENANLDKVSIALAASLNAYQGSGMSAVQVMNTLTAATGQGMMTFEQLSGSLASVLPAAAKFHISLNNVTAALATMTSQGDPAAQAATHLKQVILALEAPSKIGAAALKSVGLTSADVAIEMKKSLPGALQMITDAVGKKFPEGSSAYNQAIKNIAGGSKQMMGFLELTGSHMHTFVDNVSKISSAVKKGGNDLMGWSDIQGNFNFKMDRAKAVIEALGIKLGTVLLPALSQILGTVTPLISKFTDWISTGNRLQQFLDDTSPKMVALKIVLIALAGVIGGVMVFALVAFAVAAWAALVPMLPFIAIGVLVALAIAGIILAITHWGAIMAWIGGVFNAIGSQLRESATKVKNDVGGAFNALGTQMRDSVTKVKNDVGGIFNALGTQLRDSATKTKNDVGGAFDSMGTQMRQSATKTKNDVGNIMSGIGTIAHNTAVGAVEAGKWMYDHNTYWKASADAIGKAFSDMGTQMKESATKTKNDVGAIFNDMGTQLRQGATKTHNDVGNIFNDMGTQLRQSSTKTHNDVGAQFDDMGTQLRQGATKTKNDVGAIFSALGSFMSGTVVATVGNVLGSVGRMVGGFMSGMGSLVSGVTGKLGQLAGNFASMLGSIASQAFSWGANIIQGIINGIGSKLGDLAGMAGQAAATVGNFLGFHSPTKEGEGRNIMSWGPALVKSFAAGIDASSPMLHASLNHLIQAPTNPLIGASAGGSGSSSGNNGPVTIILQVDGRTLARALGPHMAGEIRLVTGVSR